MRGEKLFSFFLVLVSFVGTGSAVQASVEMQAAIQTAKQIALVYSGDGACDPGSESGCAESAARLAESAGYRVVFIDPQGAAIGADTEKSWAKASLWLQPGGRAKKQILAMSSALKIRIREFVRAGGGYVGFCAGGFLATEKFGWQDPEDAKNDFESDGLGLLPGYSRYYMGFEKIISEKHPALVIPTTWHGQTRSVYWELGPYFDATTLSGRVQLVSQYADGSGMSVRSTFGRGRVFVTAVHPEAPLSWYEYYKLTDDDGLDATVGLSMIRWVTTERRLESN